MAKKLDLSRFKEFMFNHGETVGLGVCAALALFLGLYGIWAAMGAGKPEGSSKTYAEHFKEIISRINASITAGAPVGKDEARAEVKTAWPQIKSPFMAAPFIHNDEALGDK